jgi:hypothetical protein
LLRPNHSLTALKVLNLFVFLFDFTSPQYPHSTQLLHSDVHDFFLTAHLRNKQDRPLIPANAPKRIKIVALREHGVLLPLQFHRHFVKPLQELENIRKKGPGELPFAKKRPAVVWRGGQQGGQEVRMLKRNLGRLSLWNDMITCHRE